MEGTRKHKKVRRLLLQLQSMPADSRSNVGRFWDLDQRRNECHGIYSDEPDRKWDKTAERMMLDFQEER